MNDLALINLVRLHTPLWDIDDKKYNDRVYKLKLWNSIGKELETDWGTCKARWTNIRDNYKKSLKRKALYANTSKKIKFYKFAQELEFLDGLGQEGIDECSNMVTDEDYFNDEEDYVNDDGDQSVEGVKYSCVLRVKEESECQSDENNDNSHSRRSKQRDTKISLLPASESAPLVIQPDITTNKTPNYNLTEPTCPINQMSKITHPVDAFLNGIAPIMKILPPYYLNRARSEIFEIVQKYDMEMITRQTWNPNDDRHGGFSTRDKKEEREREPSRKRPHDDNSEDNSIVKNEKEIH